MPYRHSHRRSFAWVLYAVLAVVAVGGAFAQPGRQTPGLLLVAALLGLYARYIYRGGRVVIVPVPGCAPVLLLVTASAVASAVIGRGLL